MKTSGRLIGCVSAGVLVGALSAGLAISANGSKATVQTATLDFEGMGSGSEGYRCKGGGQALSGGAVPLSDSGSVFLGSSAPLSSDAAQPAPGEPVKKWIVSASNMAAENVTVRAYVICAPRSDTNATIESVNFTLDSGESERRVVDCVGQARAVGGGVSPLAGGDSAVTESGPAGVFGSFGISDGDKAEGWTVGAINLSAANNREFAAYALCAKNSKAKAEVEEVVVEAGETEGVTAKCDQGERIVGGGILQNLNPDSFRMRWSGPGGPPGSSGQPERGDKATKWTAAAFNDDSEEISIKSVAICE